MHVAEVEREDIARAMREVAAGETKKDEKTKHQGRRIVRRSKIVANRVHALLSKMFELAEDGKYRPPGSNPCRGVKRFAEHKVERFLSVEELSRLGTSLFAAKDGGLIVYAETTVTRAGKRKRGGQKQVGPRFENPYAIVAVQLRALETLTFIAGLRWSSITAPMVLNPETNGSAFWLG